MLTKTGRSKTYALPSSAGERFRLLSWPRIAAFTTLIVAVMAWLYPRDQLIEQVTESPAENPLSRAYLDNLIKAEPENLKLQIQKAQNHIQTGRYREARDLLQQLSQQNAPALRVEIAQALIELHEKEVFSRPPAQRQAYLPALRQALTAMSALELNPKQREQLADKAIAYGHPELAIGLYQGLALNAAPPVATHWLQQAARAALSLGRYQHASALYFEAQALASNPTAHKALFIAGVRALQAGNLPADALAAAEKQLGTLAGDPDMLEFMVRLALAANRNDRAEWYVKKLLQFAQFTPWMQAHQRPAALVQVRYAAVRPMPAIRHESPTLSKQLPGCDTLGGAPAGRCWQRVPGSHPVNDPFFRTVSQQPQLPFDDRVYRLGYEVFLANRNLADAYVLAETAVRQAPDNAAWRERYAQVAEWHGKPMVSLEQWRTLALDHDRESAWQSVLRLAPGLFDEETVVLALTREYRKGRLDDTRLNRLVEAFEGMGEPGKGVAFLEQAYRDKPRRLLLVKQAWLEERMGLAPQAIATLRRLQRAHGLNTHEARHLAALLILQGNMTQSYQVLQQYQSLPGAKDREYQALLGELAWRLQDGKAARQIYQRLYASGGLEEYETERLILLLREANPGIAARLAARHWTQHHNPRFLLTALSLHVQDNDLAAARALLASLTPADLEKLETQPDFLQQRADIRRRDNNLAAAVQDMQRAVRLAPDDVSLNAQLLWILIEARQIDVLEQELALRHPRALGEPGLWAPMGAGYALLAKPRQALPYYARQANERRGDYLWQIGYAQILEESGYADMAWRLRRHAWLNLRQAASTPQAAPEKRNALAQLALRFAPGDPGVHWLREWLRQDRGGTQQHASEAMELAAAWYLSQEQHESARIWLLQQYGKQLQAPRWAEAAIALQSNDRLKLEKIVADDGSSYDPSTRAEAAMTLEHYAAARRIASEGLLKDPGNDVLHLQRSDSIWQLQNRASLRIHNEETGALKARGWRLDGQWHVTPRLKMGLALSDDALSSLDATQLTGLPGRDRTLKLSAWLKHDKSETRVQVSSREALESTVGVEVGHRLRIDRRLQVGAALGYQVETDENAALQVGGMKDTLKLDAQWQISKRDYLLAELSTSRYFGQDRVFLGTGSSLNLQLGHRLRIDYPDLTVKLLGDVYRFGERVGTSSVLHSLLPAGAAVLPESFNQFGFGIGLGESVADNFSLALRPYASLDVLHNSQAGWGYGLELGFVVSPTGKDWLRGRYRKGSNSFDGNADTSLLGLEYRYLF
ncbi:MAG: tetratricopeptide repeat protein [Thiobacillus sp.]